MKSKMSTQMQSRVMGKKIETRVLAIDPGFDRCGVAVLEKKEGKEKFLFSKCITTNSKDPHEIRLLQINRELRAVIKKWKPNSLAIEQLFFNINIRTALKVAEARGVILSEAASFSIPVFEYSPQSIKLAVTGYGKATKSQVEIMVLKILRLNTPLKHDDETDALALGITHLASTRGI